MTDETGTDRFTAADLDELSKFVLERWTAGLGRDWMAPAGTLEWSCLYTAEHVVDCVYSYAFFLASRKTDDYPNYGELSAGPTAGPADIIVALRAVTTMLVSVIKTAEPGATAVIHRRPVIETGAPADFAPRGGLELILHAYDVCRGLGVVFDPPAALCRRLFHDTQGWPWPAREPTEDPWSDVLVRSGRPQPR